MGLQFVSCPTCGTFLLEDTAQCHSCGHVLHEDRAGIIAEFPLPTDHAVDSDMDVCQSCGERCRKGLVRCWNCGSFTRPEIAEEYERRAEAIRTRPKDDFELPVLDASDFTEGEGGATQEVGPNDSQEYLGAEDMDDFDDFEVSDDVQLEGGGILGRISDSIDEDSSPVFSLQGMDKSETAAESESIPSLNVDKDSSDSEADEKSEKSSKDAKSDDADLMNIAAAEQAEIVKAKKQIKNKDTFVVYCSHGHRIRVHEKYRGKKGRCPKCGIDFLVPSAPLPKAKKDEAETAPEPAIAVGRYVRWLDDLRMHTVVPERLKIKADSLLNEFQSVDVGFNSEEILIAVLVAAGGFFSSAAKKKPAIRTEMLEYFATPDASPDGLKVASKRVISNDTFAQMMLAQPTPIGTESLFGDIPIFGAGRIAIRLPRNPDDKGTQYLSFSLSEFRAFTFALQTICGVEGFGSNSDIPITDQFDTHKCHYNSSQIPSLRKLEYYQKDPNIKLEVTGWKCVKCGVTVSEEGRKKEKLGGGDGKGIAKAKCPKCKQPFGSNPLYKVTSEPGSTPESDADAGAEQESAAS